MKKTEHDHAERASLSNAGLERTAAKDGKAIERAVMADRSRPCLYHVAGPCYHPKCLEAHYETLRSNEPSSPAAEGSPRGARC